MRKASGSTAKPHSSCMPFRDTSRASKLWYVKVQSRRRAADPGWVAGHSSANQKGRALGWMQSSAAAFHIQLVECGSREARHFGVATGEWYTRMRQQLIDWIDHGAIAPEQVAR